MVLNTLRCRNFRNHRKLDLEFKEGITGVTGPNGSGKSSIIEAILFLLWGVFFGSKKDDVISLGETTGYVSGTFTHLGKKGRLERHLDASKVILEYDGKVLKKATEVKQLWDDLMQTTPDIAENIIVARQGDIPLLFNGSNAIREAIFQKIFLVPNTTKIRSLMYDKYISETPPAYVVANKDDLIAALKKAQEEEQLKKELLDAYPEVPQELFQNEYKLQQQWERAIADNARHFVLTAELAKHIEQLAPYEAELNLLKKKLGSIDINFYRTQQIELSRKQINERNRRQLIAKINAITVDMLNDADYQLLTDKLAKAHDTFIEKDRLHNVLNDSCVTLQEELEQYKQLKGKAICPTCNSPIHDIKNLITSKEGALSELLIAAERALAAQVEAKHNRASLTDKMRIQVDLRTRYETLEGQLKEIPEEQFNETDLLLANNIVSKYGQLEKDLVAKQSFVDSLNTKVTTITTQLQTLKKVENSADLQNAIDASKKTVSELTERATMHNKALGDYRYAQMVIEQAEKAIEANDIAIAKNKKRDDYRNILSQAYEALHTTQFPRKLIQGYSDIVSEYLGNYLAKFSIPYTAVVNDAFGIDVLDEAGRKLPLVSGGQQVIIGLCLRLALHDLFGQSFPMLIIDEGTAAMQEINRGCYFEVIRSLKETSNLKQIIVIDHHDELKQVVDNIIEL